MRKILILSIFILNFLNISFLYTTDCISQSEFSNDSVKYKYIIPKWFDDFSNLKILKDSVSLSGYLVFEFDIDKIISDTVINKEDFTSTIYVVQDLSDIKNAYKRYYLSLAMGILYNYFFIREEGIDNTYSRIISSRDYRLERKDCPNNHYKLSIDKTHIFKNENYCLNPDDENTGYFIFSTEFETLILENDLYYTNDNDSLSTITGAKVIVPFDNCIELKSVGDSVLYDTNLKKGLKEINLTY